MSTSRELTLRESAQIAAAGTTHSDWINLEYTANGPVLLRDVILVLELTAQGNWTDETLDVTVEGHTSEGETHVFTLGEFSQIGDKTSSLPYREPLKLSNCGKWIRLKIVTNGTAVAFTFSVYGYAK